MDDVGVGELVVSTEVFLGDLNCGKFMNSNSEVTETEDLPDFAWLALDLGDTRVTLIGIVPSPYQSTLGDQSLEIILESSQKVCAKKFHMCASNSSGPGWSDRWDEDRLFLRTGNLL